MDKIKIIAMCGASAFPSITIRVILMYCTVLFAISSSGQPNDADRIIAQKRGIEKQIESSRDNILVYAKVRGRSGLQKVLNGTWPDSIESVYNILKNDLGQVIYFAEFPTSQSGDWMLELKHFFNEKGQTIAFKKKLTYFNEDCGDGVVTLTLTDLYLENFQLLMTIRQVEDSKGDGLPHDVCGDPYNWPVDKSPTAKELIAFKKLRL